MKINLKIIPIDLLEEYNSQVSNNLQSAFDLLADAEMSTDSFSFYTSVASVFSSKIEGEEIDLDSYIKHKKFGIEFLPDYTKRVDDLYDAYTFAKSKELNITNIEAAHKLLSEHLVATNFQGNLRTQNMYVSTPDGKIEYVAATPFELPVEMEKYYHDVAILLQNELSINELFFFASMLHLVFVKIHPWNDGNGRCARLIEKWFLAQKLGDKAWFIQSEKTYYKQHASYYKNLRKLGLEYQELDYRKALDFVMMLAGSMDN